MCTRVGSGFCGRDWTSAPCSPTLVQAGNLKTLGSVLTLKVFKCKLRSEIWTQNTPISHNLGVTGILKTRWMSKMWMKKHANRLKLYIPAIRTIGVGVDGITYIVY